MKKILHVSCGGLGNGGVSSVILSIVSETHIFFNHDCIVFAKQGTRESEFKKYGNLYRLKCYTTGSFFQKKIEKIIRPFILALGVFRICKKNKYDIIHCHNGYENAFCLCGAFLAKVPRRITHSHNTKSPQKKLFLYNWYNSFCRFLINKLSTDKIGCSTQACIDFFETQDFEVIFNSVDLSKYLFVNRTAKDNIKFVNVGRFTYQKNQQFVIEIFEKILSIYPSATLALVGFGPLQNYLEGFVREKNLDKSVYFFDGKKSDIPNFFAESDYMIFPSQYEGFGIVLLEAQASGCYCFASDVITPEVNLGYISTLSLKDGCNAWANSIISFIKSNKKETCSLDYAKLRSFDKKEIGKRYYDFYSR